MIDQNLIYTISVLIVVVSLFISTCLMINNLVCQVNRLNSQVRQIIKSIDARDKEPEEHKIEEGDEWKYT